MKVRFTSSKEREPTVDGGIKVLYAPSKRIAYRLRWYLILLLVASPVLWFVGKMISGMVLLDAPARTVKLITEIRAFESGVIRDIPVATGDRVTAGKLLILLENPVLTAQNQAIRDTLQVELNQASAPLLPQQQILLQQLDRARMRSVELERLVDMSAATRGELNQALDLLNDRQSALAEFERTLKPTIDQQVSTQRNKSELVALEKRLEQLNIKAESDAIVRSIEINEGETVGPGTLLMQLQQGDSVEIQVFLDARQRQLARPGQALKLRLPDGDWLDAKVTSEPWVVTRLPADIRSPFGANELGLLLKVEPVDPLAPEWQLDNLPLTARFPNQIQRWLQ